MTWVHPTFLFLIPVALVAVWQLFHRASTGGWVSLPNIHRLWVIETGNERGHVPVLNGLGFRVSHRWTVSGIWLVLYTRPG